MSFISVQQYLNKLQIVYFILLIVPLSVFIALYFFASEYSAVPRREYFIVIPLVAVAGWLLAIITFNKKIKSVRNLQGLGVKLQKYFNITIVRYSFLCSAALILAVGYYLTHNDTFTGLFLVGLIHSLFYWPTGPKVAKELALRGDEKEMVHFRKDRL
jgi:hypothetical protein